MSDRPCGEREGLFFCFSLLFMDFVKLMGFYGIIMVLKQSTSSWSKAGNTTLGIGIGININAKEENKTRRKKRDRKKRNKRRTTVDVKKENEKERNRALCPLTHTSLLRSCLNARPIGVLSRFPFYIRPLFSITFMLLYFFFCSSGRPFLLPTIASSHLP